MIFMLMFSGTEHKYIIQVNKYKVINVLPHNIVHQPQRLMGHYIVRVAIQCIQKNHIALQMLSSLMHI